MGGGVLAFYCLDLPVRGPPQVLADSLVLPWAAGAVGGVILEKVAGGLLFSCFTRMSRRQEGVWGMGWSSGPQARVSGDPGAPGLTLQGTALSPGPMG